MPHPTLISLGSINMDMQVRANRWPDAGETLLASDFLMTGGGKAANVAVLARRLGKDVALIGHVGDDVLAGEVLRRLGDAAVDLKHVTRRSGTATAVSTIVVRPDGDKTIILAPNANLDWDERGETGDIDRLVESAPEGSVLVTDLEIPVPVVRRAIAAARERSLPIVLDPSPADRMPDDLYESVTVLTPNQSEAGQLTGVTIDSDESAEHAGHKLLERGASVVCQKRHGGGCVVVTESGTTHIRPVPVDIVDLTGAGDAFAGAMGVALLDGNEPVQAALIAVAASHCAVTAFGSQQSYPTRGALDRMIERLAHENGHLPEDT